MIGVYIYNVNTPSAAAIRARCLGASSEATFCCCAQPSGVATTEGHVHQVLYEHRT